MAYRLTATDPYVRAAIGAFNGYGMRGGSPISVAALIKRRSTGGWRGIYVVDNGGTSNYFYPMELNPSNVLRTDVTTAGWGSLVFTSTVDWMILGWTWGGAAGDFTYRTKVGAAAWVHTPTTATAASGVAGSGYRHLIGNEAGLGDDTDIDVVAIGEIKSNLSQATFESLTMADIASWDAVFTGPGAWLLGFDDISTRTDRTGNGGNEVGRSAGITLVADPAGFDWGAAGGDRTVPSEVAALQLAGSASTPKVQILVPASVVNITADAPAPAVRMQTPTAELQIAGQPPVPKIAPVAPAAGINIEAPPPQLAGATILPAPAAEIQLTAGPPVPALTVPAPIAAATVAAGAPVPRVTVAAPAAHVLIQGGPPTNFDTGDVAIPEQVDQHRPAVYQPDQPTVGRRATVR